MNPRTIKITHWILIVLLCLFLLADAYGGITKQQAGIDVLHHLGYPIYLMPLFGVLKLLAIVALLQTRFATIKEWAFAGIAFTFIGAAVSHICAHDAVVETVMPLVFLVYLFVTRMFWNKYLAVKNAA